MVQVVLHIGLPKSGSTFLQTQVFPRMQGVRYKKYYNLFSSESLAGNIVYTDKYYRCSRDELLRRMKLVFPDASILLVLRDRKSLVRSSYKQYIRSSYDTLSFDEWMSAHKDNSFESFFDYLGYIRRLRSTFDNVCVLHYEDLVSDAYGFVEAVCGFVGVPMVDFDNVVVNKKPSSLELIYFKLRNKYNLKLLSRYNVERKIEGG